MQSRWHSLVESVTNIFIGFLVSLLAQVLFFPWFGINIPLEDNLALGALFTIVSLVRSYVLRRYFNRKVLKIEQK